MRGGEEYRCIKIQTMLCSSARFCCLSIRRDRIFGSRRTICSTLNGILSKACKDEPSLRVCDWSNVCISSKEEKLKV